MVNEKNPLNNETLLFNAILNNFYDKMEDEEQNDRNFLDEQ